jgi:hypothetical protein
MNSSRFSLFLLVSIACIALLNNAAAQTPDRSSGYQPGTITAVSVHGSAAENDNPQYDVTVLVKDTEYQVLFTPPSGSSGVKFAKGRTVLVKVGASKLAFRDFLGREFEAPIVSSKPVAATKQEPDKR